MDNTFPNNPQNPQNPQQPQYPPTPQFQAPTPGYSGQPPYGQPPTPPNRRRLPQLKTWQWIAAGVGALVIVCCLCGGLVSAMNGANSANNANITGASNTNPTATHSGPTATPKPTATNAPTATPAPPTPTTNPLVLRQQVAQNLADQNCDFTTDSQKATYKSDGTVDIKAVVGTQWDISSAQQTVKELVFECFKGFYTSPHAGFVKDVYVEVDGPVTDAYGNNSTGIYGYAELSRISAQPFSWDNLDSTTAWDNNIYDDQWVRTK